MISNFIFFLDLFHHLVVVLYFFAVFWVVPLHLHILLNAHLHVGLDVLYLEPPDQSLKKKSEDTVRGDVLSSFISKLNSCVKYSAFVVFNAARISPYCNTKPKSLFLER